MNPDSIMNEKLSIQNILFTKALPNYKIPIPTDGYKVFPCIDCGDRFLFESSQMIHINRKSILITYFCRYCNTSNEFYNRCQFLSHIRSHLTRTATINLSDIKVEPIPFAMLGILSQNPPTGNQITKHSKFKCFECKKDISVSGIREKDRAQHYMETIKMVNCPVCLFASPSTCGLIAHLRIHLKTPPFICCECGKHLSLRACIYPFNHDCEGFKMMRVTTRLKCFNDRCPAVHPNNYVAHLEMSHLNKIYKCPNCYLAGYNEHSVLKHILKCCNKNKYLIYFECQKCPGNFLNSSQTNKHLEKHFVCIQKSYDSQLFPCWNCGLILNNVYDFLNHHVSKRYSNAVHKILVNVIKNVKNQVCSTCQKTFLYWLESPESPNKCLRCKINENSQAEIVEISSDNTSNCNMDLKIKCHLCSTEVPENWKDIKMHYNNFHKSVKCLDLKLVLSKLNLKDLRKNTILSRTSKKITKHFKQRPTNIRVSMGKARTATINEINTSQYHTCSMCNYNSNDRISLESHLKTHRDPDMAYQCMECGNSLAVKPSFATHLLLEHNILNVEDYIKTKDCFNKLALEKKNPEKNLPLEKNQCNVCRDKFSDSNTLEKHYRIHGMAFLVKNTKKSKSQIETKCD